MSASTTALVRLCLERLQGGDPAARGDLLRAASDRMLLLTRRMPRRYQGVARWEQTGDVCQNAMLRMCRAHEHLLPPSPLDFFKLASTHIRRELIDLARHYDGPRGVGANHASAFGGESRPLPPNAAPGDDEDDPHQLALWTEFHRQAETLPGDEKTVFDLVWYHGLPQKEVAEVLGVSVRSVKTR